MYLSYPRYLELITALDEYSKCSLNKKELQEAIFNHFAEKYGSFAAENCRGVKRVFVTKFQRKKSNKKERKLFIKFIEGNA